jgi:hypothetical protein
MNYFRRRAARKRRLLHAQAVGLRLLERTEGELIAKTVAQQEAKADAAATLRRLGLPLPPDLAAEGL